MIYVISLYCIWILTDNQNKFFWNRVELNPLEVMGNGVFPYARLSEVWRPRGKLPNMEFKSFPCPGTVHP